MSDPWIRPRHRRDPGVEANARLTGSTGLLLVVMLAAEGFTILRIHRYLTWHIAIGLALLPPVALKLSSTLWRFSRYYLRDPRYRRAGPPAPLLRLLGPLVVASTVAVLATGVALWLAGPRHPSLLTLHKVSFIVWFALMAIHVLAHVLRAVRLSAADLAGPSSRRYLPRPRLRQGLVLASLVAGVILGLLTKGLVKGWGSFGRGPF